MAADSGEIDQEIELIRRVAGGDREGFVELYDRFSRVLYSAAYRILGNMEDAEDVVQDVFVQIWEKANLYEPTRGKPLTWALTLTRNKSIDRRRAVLRRNRLNDEAELEAKTSLEGDHPDSVLEVYSAEHGAIIRDAVTELSAEQREAIDLAFFGGLTQMEVAEKLGTPLGTVKARIRRGMIRLREIMTARM